MNSKSCSISVALNVCNGLHGLIQTGQDGYMITPVDNHNHDIESEHEVTRVSPINRNDFMSKNFISKREVSGKNSNKVMTELQSSL